MRLINANVASGGTSHDPEMQQFLGFRNPANKQEVSKLKKNVAKLFSEVLEKDVRLWQIGVSKANCGKESIKSGDTLEARRGVTLGALQKDNPT